MKGALTLIAIAMLTQSRIIVGHESGQISLYRR